MKYQLIKHREPPHHFDFPPKQYKDSRNPKGYISRYCKREWFKRYNFIAYSVKSDGLFCLACVLFPDTSHRRASFLIEKPYNNWKDATTDLNTHLKTEYHMTSFAKFNSFMQTYEHPSTRIDSTICEENVRRVNKNREILKSIIRCIQFCGKQGIALRGNRDNSVDNDPSLNHGNFRALLNFRVEAGDSVLKEHLLNCDKNASYISNTAQNEFLFCIKDFIQSQIISEVKEQIIGPYYGIQCDEVNDSSNWEQLGLMVRYVKANIPVEKLLLFIPVDDLTGASLCKKIIEALTQHGLDIQFCRSQTMDGAGNMAGHVKGCAALFTKESPKAVYHYCSSHDLNLALGKSCKIREIQLMLDSLTQLGIFFKYSPKRSRRLELAVSEFNQENSDERQCKKSKIKVFCATRWVEKHNTLENFLELYVPIVKTLEAIATSERGWDTKSSSDAYGLMKKITDSEFIVAFYSALYLFGFTKGLSTKLQGSSLDIIEAYKMVNTVISLLIEIREQEDDFTNLYNKMTSMAESVGVGPLQRPRRCEKQTHRNNVSSDSGEQYFKRAVYLPFLDSLIQELRYRFNGLSAKSVLALKILPNNRCQLETDDEESIVNYYFEDLPNPSSFHQELLLWKIMWREETNQPDSISSTLSHPKVCRQMFPNITTIFYHLLLTSVTASGVERANSNLRFIKNAFRSTMGDDRFNALILMYIHKDIELDIEKIIDSFAQRNPRRMLLLNPLN